MFDLVTGTARRIPGGGTGPVMVSSVLHLAGLGVIVALPLLFVKQVLPDVPTMLAFVATMPEAPPPPPAAAAATAERRPTPATPTPSPAAAPVDAPREVVPEPAVPPAEPGVAGGVEGGVPEGVLGGVVGGLPDQPPPPPPPPPPAPEPPRGPVRIGGQVQPPTLIRRVEPEYPVQAALARVQGVVILEATVSADGYVQDVRVLKSVPLLERAALEAVRQWRYSPVVLNGQRVPFILTVVVSFTVPDGRSAGIY
jgi:protein TonB